MVIIKINYLVATILNDFKTLISSYKKVILGYIISLIFLLFYFVLNNKWILTNEIFSLILGLNYRSGGDFFGFLTLLLNVFLYFYISFNLLLKDIKMQYCNLFLRIKSRPFFIKKLISIISVVTVVKLCSYMIIGSCSLLVNTDVSLVYVIELFTKDLLYIISIQLIFFSLIFMIYSFPKVKTLFLLGVIPIFLGYVIKISTLKISIIGLVNIVVLGIVIVIFSKNFRTIFEEIENGG